MLFLRIKREAPVVVRARTFLVVGVGSGDGDRPGETRGGPEARVLTRVPGRHDERDAEL